MQQNATKKKRNKCPALYLNFRVFFCDWLSRQAHQNKAIEVL